MDLRKLVAIVTRNAQQIAEARKDIAGLSGGGNLYLHKISCQGPSSFTGHFYSTSEHEVQSAIDLHTMIRKNEISFDLDIAVKGSNIAVVLNALSTIDNKFSFNCITLNDGALDLVENGTYPAGSFIITDSVKAI